MEEPQGYSASPDDRSAFELAYREESAEFVGRWYQLVSTTNWEKGRIICQWRDALLESSAPPTEYSDEAWSRRVGGVTGQHVGRLRRVYQRFGQVYSQYRGLYWSHFQAGLDWEDAELWLEGAVQNSWSVSQMRRKRWEVLGAPEELKPREEDIVVGELDEDFEPALRESPEASADQEEPSPLVESWEPPASGAEREEPAEPDGADERGDSPDKATAHRLDDDLEDEQQAVRPFADLAELPADVSEAFEAFKLAILRHKTDGWKQISCDDLLAALDSLKQLAVAPAAVGGSA